MDKFEKLYEVLKEWGIEPYEWAKVPEPINDEWLNFFIPNSNYLINFNRKTGVTCHEIKEDKY